jgi:shikimate kinase
MKIKNNIFLVGLMGSGKTTIGKLIAKKLRYKFIDTDLLMEEKTGVKVPLIFEYEGEEGFRKREAKILSEVLRLDNIILATGGGIVLSDNNRQQLKERGNVIYLNAEINELAKRLSNDKTRPLLQNTDIKEKLKELMGHRSFLYESIADSIIQTKNKRAPDIANEIITNLGLDENN